MKKLLTFILSLLLTLVFALPISFAEEAEYTLDSSIKAPTILLADLNSGKILYSKGSTTRVYPASTTKIMTILLAIENLDLSGEMTVHEAACNYPSTQSLLGLKADEVIPIKDVIYGTMLVSGNDGATALAIQMAGSTTEFAVMMNKKAKELGMTNTSFVNPHGLQNENHYTTAEDMLKLTMYAMKNETFRDVVSTATYQMSKTNKNDARTVSNTNRLIVQKYPDKESTNPYYYEDAIGIKTGSTPTAKSCLVAAAEKDDMLLGAFVYADPSTDGVDRWKVCASLFNWGFENYATVNLSELLSTKPITKMIENGSTADGTSNIATFSPNLTGDDIYLTTDKATIATIKENASDISITTTFDDNLTAPLTKGVKYGTASVSYGGNVLTTFDLYATADMAAGEDVSPIQSASTIDPSDLSNKKTISPWWLLIFPVILIAILIFRIMAVNKKKKINIRRKVKPYHYRMR